MPTRAEIVGAARRYVGTPYHHQGALRGAGCDCIGLLRGVWRDLYGREPEAVPPYGPDVGETAAAELMLEAGRRHMLELPPGAARAGDALVFRIRPRLIAKHVAILTGPATMVHAVTNDRVREVRLSRFWRGHAVAGFAFPGVTG